MEKTKKEIYESKIKLYQIFGFIGIGMSLILGVLFIIFSENNITVFGFKPKIIMVTLLTVFFITFILGKIVERYRNLVRKEEESAEKIEVKVILKLLGKRNYPDAISAYNEKIIFKKTKKFLTPFILSELLNSRNNVYIGYAEEIISSYYTDYEEFFLDKINL